MVILQTPRFELGGEMNFVLLRADYDRYTERAYVEFRAPHADGGEQPLLIRIGSHHGGARRPPLQVAGVSSQWRAVAAIDD